MIYDGCRRNKEERDGQQHDGKGVAQAKGQDRLVGPAGTDRRKNKRGTLPTVSAAVNFPILIPARPARKTMASGTL